MAKIVVVEDEEAIRQLIVEELEDGGHEVIPARDGQEGLEVIVREKPDLVLSDITMPRMNGHELLVKLQESYPQRIHTPFIFLSALADRQDMVAGLKIGADDYLTKPVDFELLLAKVQTRLHANALLKQQHELAMAKLYKHMSQQAAAGADASASVERLPGAAPSQKSAAAAASSRQEWLAKITDGTIVAGHVETVSLQRIRDKLGADWERVAQRMLRIADEIVHQNIGDGDMVEVTSSQDFVIAFALPDETHANIIARKIALEIWEVLFGELKDSELAEVRSCAHTVDVSLEEIHEAPDIAKMVASKVRQRSDTVTNDAEKNLLRTYQYEDIHLVVLYTSAGAATRMRMAQFARPITQKIHDWASPGVVSKALLATLDVLFLRRVADMMASMGSGALPVAVVPIRYVAAANKPWLAAYITEFEKIDTVLRPNLLLKLVDLPSRLASHDAVVTALPGAGRARVLEINTPQQIERLDLRGLRVGLLAMKSEDIAACDRSALRRLQIQVATAGAKLIVENLPEDKTVSIKRLGADLFTH